MTDLGVRRKPEWPPHLVLRNNIPKPAVLYRMKFVKEEPLRVSADASPKRTKVLDRTTESRVCNALAFFGVQTDVDADGVLDLKVDGHTVLADVDLAPSAWIGAERFLPTELLFPAEGVDGKPAGLFLPNGTKIEAFVRSNGAAGAPARFALELAEYTINA